MGKRSNIEELVIFLVIFLTHHIGGVVNPNAIYSEKYKKESETFLRKAKKICLRENWNLYDKKLIKNKLKNKLYHELLKRNFLDNKKFELIDEEIDKVMSELDLG